MPKEFVRRELEDLAGLSHKTSTDFLPSCCISAQDSDEECYKSESFTSYENPAEIDVGLNLTENHFSRPEGYFCFSTSEELEMAIEQCKEMIRTEAGYDRKKQLVAKLVQLKLKLQEIKDPPEIPLDMTIVLGHKFELRSLERPQQYCEKCCGIIWGVIKNWYRCVECGFKCHSKCLNLITRICASTKVAENSAYELSICPELGLSQQKFRCAECKKKFIFRIDFAELYCFLAIESLHFEIKRINLLKTTNKKNDLCLPRLCDYNGLFYCSRCHWNSLIVIPARVIHNWDFTPRKTCRASLQFLRLMSKKPILNIESLNPTLFAFVDDLRTIKKLREDILLMKKYFLTCHTALEEKLLLQLKDRQHFVESADIYSLQDLIDVSSGSLLTYLEKIHAMFVQHITQQCQGCRGKGFICEFCKSDDVIFPFDPRTDICATCSSVFHQDCYLRWEGPCPKCARKAKVSGATQS